MTTTLSFLSGNRLGNRGKASSMLRQRIVLASSNQGKIREIRALLGKHLDLEVVSQDALGISGAEESGLTFIENAIIKARHVARLSSSAVIADDSGLAVDALGGAPGIFSARYAGAGADDAANVGKLLAALDCVPDEQRGARFYCVMVLLRHAEDPQPLIGEGTWEGCILREPRGAGGFGYDPVFWIGEKRCTVAALPAEEKNALSHRSKALQALLRRL
jgi:XTP/dITP diphosphohydrolase